MSELSQKERQPSLGRTLLGEQDGGVTTRADPPPQIILQAPAVPSLFWTTGVYYLWELSRHHSVTLIVNDRYRADPLFDRCLALCRVAEVIYEPSASHIFARHWYYSRKLRELVAGHGRVVVLQANDVYPDNLYLAKLAKRRSPRNIVVVFQEGQQLRDYSGDYHGRTSFGTDRLVGKYDLPRWLALVVYRSVGAVRHALEFYLVPFMLSAFTLSPRVHLRTGRIIRRNLWKNLDAKLYYRNLEMQVSEGVEQDTENRTRRVVIKHPVETSGEQCNASLYEATDEPTIACLPSWGLSNRLGSERTLDESALVESIAAKWCDVIKTCQYNRNGWRIVWKLHPAAANDRVLCGVTEILRIRCPQLVIVKPTDNAMGLIIQARLILSDVSTVLWWASFLRCKTAISLDIFGYPGGNGMRGCEGVFYCRSTAALGAYLQRSDVTSGPNDKRRGNPPELSLSVWLDELLAAQPN